MKMHPLQFWITKSGWVNLNDMTIKFGGHLSKPENIITASIIKIPTYVHSYQERESLGGGWYGGMETVVCKQDNLYAIVHEGIFRGFVNGNDGKTKQNVFRLIEKEHKQAFNFLRTQNIFIP